MKWKWVKGYKNLYKISNTGLVLTYHSGKPKLLKSHKTTHGYLSVQFFKNGKNKRFSIHRLVALAFIPNPLNKCCVNHIDGDKTNNNVANLEWSTHTENLHHAFRTGLNKCRKEIIVFNWRKNKLIGEFKSLTEASNKLSISIYNLSSHLKNPDKRHNVGSYVAVFKEKDYKNKLKKVICGVRRKNWFLFNKVYAKKLEDDEWYEYENASIMIKELKFEKDSSNVRACLMGKRNICKGYEFKMEVNDDCTEGI